MTAAPILMDAARLDSIVWTPLAYHVFTHPNTPAVILGTNALPSVQDDQVVFLRKGDALGWIPDPAQAVGWLFERLPEAAWGAIEAKVCAVVEFGHKGPLTEHAVSLHAFV